MVLCRANYTGSRSFRREAWMELEGSFANRDGACPDGTGNMNNPV